MPKSAEQRERELNAEIGQRYGRLIVLSRKGQDKKGNNLFLCECDCGAHRVVKLGQLHSHGGNRVSACHKCSKAKMVEGFSRVRRKPIGSEATAAQVRGVRGVTFQG